MVGQPHGMLYFESGEVTPHERQRQAVIAVYCDEPSDLRVVGLLREGGVRHSEVSVFLEDGGSSRIDEARVRDGYFALVAVEVDVAPL